jgi:hypothetical protein
LLIAYTTTSIRAASTATARSLPSRMWDLGQGQPEQRRYDLDTALITQMTDLQNRRRPGGSTDAVAAANNALYFGWQGAIIELDLDTLEERTARNQHTHCSIDAGWQGGVVLVGPDGVFESVPG